MCRSNGADSLDFRWVVARQMTTPLPPGHFQPGVGIDTSTPFGTVTRTPTTWANVSPVLLIRAFSGVGLPPDSTSMPSGAVACTSRFTMVSTKFSCRFAVNGTAPGGGRAPGGTSEAVSAPAKPATPLLVQAVRILAVSCMARQRTLMMLAVSPTSIRWRSRQVPLSLRLHDHPAPAIFMPFTRNGGRTFESVTAG